MAAPLVFFASFPARAALAGPERLAKAEAVLQKLVSRIDQQPRLRPVVSISGFFAEALQERSSPPLLRLAELHADRRALILSSPFYDPDPKLLEEGDLERHLERCRSFWQRLGAESLGPLWLSEPLWQSIPRGESALTIFVKRSPGAADVRSFTPGELIAVEHAPDRRGFLLESASAESLDALLERAAKGAAAGARASSLLALHLPVESLLDEALDISERNTAGALDLICEAVAEGLVETVFPGGVAPAERAAPLAEPAPPVGVPSQPWQDAQSILQRIDARYRELRDQLTALPGEISQQAHAFANQERMQGAEEWLLRAQHRGDLQDAASPFEHYLARRRLFAALLQAQVKIDSIRHPEIDPVQGWIVRGERVLDAESGAEDFFDTPFLRCYVRRTGNAALTELDYKPRKLNLLNTALPARGFSARLVASLDLPTGGAALLGTEASEDAPDGALELGRLAPDVAVLRSRTLLSLGDYRATLIRDITFKAGLGAHLPNATTGFSIEYWLEGAVPPEGAFLVLEATLMLPSGNAEGMRVRPLMCVGAVSETSHLLTEPCVLTPPMIPGGVYGARLIDGIEHFTIDLRSAKWLDLLQVLPVPDAAPDAPPDPDGITHRPLLIRLASQARLRHEDTASNTLFVSIN